MKPFLMFEDRDFEVREEFFGYEEDLVKDLGLDVVYGAIYKEDETIWRVFKTATLDSVVDKEAILYRQDALKDALFNKDLIKRLYELSKKCLDEERRVFFGFFRKYPDVILYSSIKRIEISIKYIESIMKELKKYSNDLHSKAFLGLVKRLDENFETQYLKELQKHLNGLGFKDEIVIGCTLSKGLNFTDQKLLKRVSSKKGWFEKILHKRDRDFIYCINPKDESGERIISDIKNRGINRVADTLFKTANHLRGFIKSLRDELAFYVGAINLEEILRELKCDITYPKVFPPSKRVEEFKGLKDTTLVLTKKSGVVSNDLLANDKDLFIITGANKGGKTSFVRALGVAQIFTQCGLFVTAKECKLNICQKIFTHFKKEEDSTLKSGKFDEELKRLNLIVDRLKPNSLMIFNESFSSTNEAEASLIAQEIIQALIDKRVKVFFVTHMYSFANSFYSKEAKNCIYLRAQRGDDGKRSYKITVSSPQPTSYASDIYLKVFGK